VLWVALGAGAVFLLGGCVVAILVGVTVIRFANEQAELLQAADSGWEPGGNPTADNPRQGSPYTSAIGNFPVDFPGTPQVNTDQADSTVGQLPMVNTLVELPDDHVFQVTFNDYPAESIDANGRAVLQAVGQGQLNSLGGTPISSSEFTLYGFPVREMQFHGRAEGRPITGRSRCLLVNNRLYQIF
jgi:hypothetical protein